jgi:hypothetical protein
MRKIDKKKVMECERLQEWLKENPKKEVGETIWQKEKRKLKRLLKSLGVVKPFNTRYRNSKISIKEAIKLSYNHRMSGTGPRMSKIAQKPFRLTKRLPGSFGSHSG